MYLPFNELPSNARIWLYASYQPLSLSHQALIIDRLVPFLHVWQSHQKEVHASFTILEDRFLVIGSDETSNEISGCGIDKSVQLLQALESETGLSLLDKSFVYFDSLDGVIGVPFGKIRGLISQQKITEETLFYNTLIKTKGELEGGFKIPSKSGWVNRYFSVHA